MATGRRHGAGGRADKPVERVEPFRLEIDVDNIRENDLLSSMVVSPDCLNPVHKVVIPFCSMSWPQATRPQATRPQATWNDRLDRPNW